MSFKCEVPDSSGWKYQWFKDDMFLYENPNFTNHNASSSDNGTYKCTAKRDKSNYSAEPSEQALHVIGENNTCIDVLCSMFR